MAINPTEPKLITMTNSFSEKRRSTFIHGMLIVCLCWIFSLNISGQSSLKTYMEFGENSVSPGLYILPSAIMDLKLGKYTVGAGIQSELENFNKFLLSGFSIDAARSFPINETLFGIKGFYVLKGLSEIIHEANIGGLIEMKLHHFDMILGTNFRTISFTKKAVKEYSIENYATDLKEAFNVIYSFEYSLRPVGNPWNLCLSITDIDDFLFNQETNPILKFGGYSRVSKKIRIDASISYKMAGITNIAFGFFGYTLKTGITWNF
jgi:hypothetical protein